MMISIVMQVSSPVLLSSLFNGKENRLHCKVEHHPLEIEKFPSTKEKGEFDLALFLISENDRVNLVFRNSGRLQLFVERESPHIVRAVFTPFFKFEGTYAGNWSTTYNLGFAPHYVDLDFAIDIREPKP